MGNAIITDIVNHFISLPSSIPVKVIADIGMSIDTSEGRASPVVFGVYLLKNKYICPSPEDKDCPVVTNEGCVYLQEFIHKLLSWDYFAEAFVYNSKASMVIYDLQCILNGAKHLDPDNSLHYAYLINVVDILKTPKITTNEDIVDIRTGIIKVINLITDKDLVIKEAGVKVMSITENRATILARIIFFLCADSTKGNDTPLLTREGIWARTGAVFCSLFKDKYITEAEDNDKVYLITETGNKYLKEALSKLIVKESLTGIHKVHPLACWYLENILEAARLADMSRDAIFYLEGVKIINNLTERPNKVTDKDMESLRNKIFTSIDVATVTA